MQQIMLLKGLKRASGVPVLYVDNSLNYFSMLCYFSATVKGISYTCWKKMSESDSTYMYIHVCNQLWKRGANHRFDLWEFRLLTGWQKAQDWDRPQTTNTNTWCESCLFASNGLLRLIRYHYKIYYTGLVNLACVLRLSLMNVLMHVLKRNILAADL